VSQGINKICVADSKDHQKCNPFAKGDQFRYGREKESTLSEKD